MRCIRASALCLPALLVVSLGSCATPTDATSQENSSTATESVVGSINASLYYAVVAKHSGKALDVYGASRNNGANVQQWARNGTDAQNWRFEPTTDGHYVVRAKCSNKALDVQDVAKVEGANVQQWDYGNGDNQKWRLENAGDGYYYLRAKHSGLYLDVAWASKDDGANVAQVKYYGSDAQKWKLIPGDNNAEPTPPAPSPTTPPSVPAPANPPPGPGNGERLVWSDEFSADGLPDPAKWGYDVGGSGWGNGELQYYTDRRRENARVENGTLVIEARREGYQGRNYTSARLVSRGKGDWLYGRFEARAKLPSARGTWPAIWMLPTDWAYGGWPASGEIDIMEHVGFDYGKVHGTVHTKAYNHTIGTQRGTSTTVPDASSAFHVYSLEWTAERIDILVDGTRYFSFNNEHTGSAVWPFDKRFHWLLNIAVGGSWGGVQGVDDGAFPQRMVVDYVRVYQRQ